MAQQTAVEWYIEAISRLEKSLGWETENDILNQAKAMEKEQIINAGNKCAQMHKEFMNMLDSLTTKDLYEMKINTTTFGEQYYNETYNKCT
jgi:hypothetical protein